MWEVRQTGNFYIHRSAHIGIGQTAKIFKMRFPFIRIHINIMKIHLFMSPVFCLLSFRAADDKMMQNETTETAVFTVRKLRSSEV